MAWSLPGREPRILIAEAFKFRRKFVHHLIRSFAGLKQFSKSSMHAKLIKQDYYELNLYVKMLI